MSDSDNDIKTCPFCGNHPTLTNRADGSFEQVACYPCGIFFVGRYALQQWNTRST